MASSYDKYELIGSIGEGTYGRVYKARKVIKILYPTPKSDGPLSCIDTKSKQFFAIKSIKASPKSKIRNATSVSTLREVKLLSELKHPNVVHLEEILPDILNSQLAMVFNFCQWDLKMMIDHHRDVKQPMEDFAIKSVIWQALKGLAYLHENWVIHRDIKVCFVCMYVTNLSLSF